MNHIRRSIALSMIIASLHLSLGSALATPRAEASVATGIMSLAGTATVDGSLATSGQTIFSGSRISVDAGSRSIVDLGKRTRLLLSAETALSLDFSSTQLAALLEKGVVRAFIAAGLPVTIRTAGGELVTDASQPSVFSVSVDEGVTKVLVETGKIEVRGQDGVHALGAGQTFVNSSRDQGEPAAPQNNLTGRQKFGLFAAIGAAAAILAATLLGRDKEEEQQFGGCVIILSGTNPNPGICF